MIKKGKVIPFGKLTLDFLCPNCGERNEYELSYNKAIPALFEKEKKCKNCGAEYIPNVEVELKPYVTFNR